MNCTSFYGKNELGARKTSVFINSSAADNSKTIIFVVGKVWNLRGSRGFGHAICGISRGTAAKVGRYEPANAPDINQLFLFFEARTSSEQALVQELHYTILY